jgi:hypothetical protein
MITVPPVAVGAGADGRGITSALGWTLACGYACGIAGGAQDGLACGARGGSGAGGWGEGMRRAGAGACSINGVLGSRARGGGMVGVGGAGAGPAGLPTCAFSGELGSGPRAGGRSTGSSRGSTGKRGGRSFGSSWAASSGFGVAGRGGGFELSLGGGSLGFFGGSERVRVEGNSAYCAGLVAEGRPLFCSSATKRKTSNALRRARAPLEQRAYHHVWPCPETWETHHGAPSDRGFGAEASRGALVSPNGELAPSRSVRTHSVGFRRGDVSASQIFQTM